MASAWQAVREEGRAPSTSKQIRGIGSVSANLEQCEGLRNAETRASRTCSTLSLLVDRGKSDRDAEGPGDDKEDSDTRESKNI